MPLVSHLKSHDYKFRYQVPQGTWHWTTRMDTSGPTPTFAVIDILSPYGLLRDSIPLPGDVVTKMAESIAELTQAFSPRILLSVSDITLTLDEGRKLGEPQTVTVTNSGTYGSVLATTITSGAGYVQATPAVVTGLAANASGVFEVSADATSLTAAGSPYSVQLSVQDPRATNNPQTIDVTLAVRPKATISAIPDDLSFDGTVPVGSPAPSVPPQTFQVVNSGPGGSVLDFQIQKLTGLSPWLIGFTPNSGSLVGGAGTTITVNVSASGMAPGTYEEWLRVSGYSSNSYQDVYITFTVT